MDAEVFENPFPGLRPFEADETHLFFGRDGQSSEIVARLAQQRFVAVVGTSGSGKSSLVRAGLLPLLEGGYMGEAGSFWRFAVMRPGDSPIRNLAMLLADAAVLGDEAAEATLRSSLMEAVVRRSSLGLVEAFHQARLEPHENLLIVVDQFEEIFRFGKLAQGGDRLEEAAAFVKLLLEAAHQREVPIYVVITMRSDFLGDCSQFRDLPEALNDGQYLIPRMTRDQRRAAIEGPVAVGGATIAPRLVQRLLNDVGDDPDQLPVLQHALMRTWEAWRSESRPDEPIDLQHYAAVGELSRALSNHADQAYGELPDDERIRLVAKRLFQRLCERGADYRETRRPTKLSEICAVVEGDLQTIASVIDVFRTGGRTFLVPPSPTVLDGDSVIDISHEALIRQWGKLREWVAEEFESASVYLRLSQAAALHAEDKTSLWRDPELQSALSWREQRRPNPAWAKRYDEGFERAMSFLGESVRDQRRRRRRFPLIILAVVSIGAFAAKLLQDYNAEKNKLVESQKLAAESQKEDQSETAALLAIEARRIAKTDEATLAVWQVLGRPELLKTLSHPGLVTAAVSGDGKVLATGGRDGTLVLWDPMTGHELARKKAHAKVVSTLALSPDGKFLVSGGLDPGITAWVFTEEGLQRLEMTGDNPHAKNVSKLALSPRGDMLASGDSSGGLVLWDVTATAISVQRALPPHSGAVLDLAFNQDGQLLASASRDKTVRVWHVDRAEMVTEPLEHDAQVEFVRFSRGGIATDAGSRVRFWTGPQYRKLLPDPAESHRGEVKNWAVTQDGRQLFTGGDDEKFIVWSADESGQVAARETGLANIGSAHKGLSENTVIEGLALSPDGHSLAIAIRDMIDRAQNRVVVLNPVAPRRGFAFPTPNETISKVWFIHSGKAVAVRGRDRVLVWDLTDRGVQTARGAVGPASVSALALVSDCQAVLALDARNLARLWDLRNPADARVLVSDEESPEAGRQDIRSTNRFNPVRKRRPFAVASRASAIALTPAVFDQSTGITVVDARGQLLPIPLTKGEVSSLALSANGSRVAIGVGPEKANGTVMVWDVPNPELIQEIPQPTIGRISALALSPDGRLVAAATLVKEAKGEQTVVTVFDVKSGSELPAAPKKPLQGAISRLSFSATGRYVGGLLDGDRLAILDLRGGKWLADEQLSQTLGVRDFAFAPNGNVLVLIDRQNAVAVWELGGSKITSRRMVGPETRLELVRYSPDGRFLVAGAEDGGVFVWEASTGDPVARLRSGHRSPVSAFGFDAEGRVLASGDAMGTVAIWNLARLASERATVDELACRSASRNMAFNDWQKYMKNTSYQLTCAHLPPGADVVKKLAVEAKFFADSGDPQAAEAFESATKFALKTHDANDAKVSNDLCWAGAIREFPRVVFPACEHAVKLDPTNGHYLDSRGLARARLGEYRRAASDFQAALKSGDWQEKKREQRIRWIQELEAGRNPIDPATLENLQKEEF